MSILIKGMEMPQSCESCPCKTADAFGGLGCQATGYIPLRKANQDRPDNCPLVPVPPHGRLIDADAQDAQIEALIERHLHGYTKSTWDFVCQLRDILKRNRTVIPAEEGET